MRSLAPAIRPFLGISIDSGITAMPAAAVADVFMKFLLDLSFMVLDLSVVSEH